MADYPRNTGAADNGRLMPNQGQAWLIHSVFQLCGFFGGGGGGGGGGMESPASKESMVSLIREACTITAKFMR